MPYKDPEQQRLYKLEYGKKWRKEHPREVRLHDIRRAKLHKKKYWSNPEYREKVSKYQREFKAKQKRIVMEHYGGKIPRCICCGESIYEFLNINHINNDGAIERKELGGTSGVIRRILREEFPKGYNILCFNCNIAQYHYKTCPHKRK